MKTHTICSVILVAAVASLQAATWDNGGDQATWESANNWNPNGVVGSLGNTETAAGIYGVYNVSLNSDITKGALSNTVDLNGGAILTVGSGAVLPRFTALRVDESSTGASTVIFNGGGWMVSASDADSRISIGKDARVTGTSKLQINGGTISNQRTGSNSRIDIGQSTFTGTAVLEVTGGALTNSSYTGFAGAATGNAQLLISGGSVKMNDVRMYTGTSDGFDALLQVSGNTADISFTTLGLYKNAANTSGSATAAFVAGAGGVSRVDVNGALNLGSGTARGDLQVDLRYYRPWEAGGTLVLFEYNTLSGTFGSTNVLLGDNMLGYELDYAYQSNKIALVNVTYSTIKVATGVSGNVDDASAELQSEITYVAAGGADLWIYYGTNDGVTVAGDWKSRVPLGTGLTTGIYSGAVSGLLPDQNYYYRAYAENGGTGTWAASSQSFITGLDPASAPAGLTATGGWKKNDLTWDEGFSTETGFVVERSTNALFSGNVTRWLVAGGNVTNTTDASPVPGITNYYRVAATNVVGLSAWSASASATAISSFQSVSNAVEILSEFRFSDITGDPDLRKLWWDMTWAAWDHSADQYKADFSSGFVTNNCYFDAPPPAYSHPRAYLRAGQLPALRDRVTNDAATAIYWTQYKKECDKLYAMPVFMALEAGMSYGTFLSYDAATLQEMAFRMMWESFRILVEDDPVKGARLADVATKYAVLLQAVSNQKRVGANDIESVYYADIRSLPDYMKEKTLGDKRYQELTGYFQEYSIAFIYDFIYPYMDETQRTGVRKLIGDLTRDIWIHAMGVANTGGNWGPHHWKGALAALCIEGEGPDYDPDCAAGLKQVMSSYFSSDFTEAGITWEGLGKGTLGSIGLMIAAQRGWDFAAAQTVRRAVGRQLMHSMVPNDRNPDCIIALGGLGSTERKLTDYAANAYILRYFYPDDPMFEYLSRVATGESYAKLSAPFSISYAGQHNYLVNLITLSSCTEGQTLEQSRLAAGAAAGTSLFCPEYSLLSAREDWSETSPWLFFWNISFNYGHTRSERGSFAFAALGRLWSRYPYGRGDSPYADSYDAHNTSLVTVDDRAVLGSPSRMIAHSDQGWARFATADLKFSWDWQDGGTNYVSESISPVTMAAMQPLYANPPEWHKVPQSLFPHFLNPGEPGDPDRRLVHLPVSYAYRTAGLVTGTKDYALILDDMEVDGATHEYSWLMQLPSDVQLLSRSGNDIFLTETNAPADQATPRRLLVRILQTDNSGTGALSNTVVSIEKYNCNSDSIGDLVHSRLRISSRTAALRMKVLLHAFNDGADLPQTVWNGDQLTIAWSGQTDVIDFSVDSEEMSCFTLNRTVPSGGSPVVLTPVHVPLPGNSPPPDYAQRGYAAP